MSTPPIPSHALVRIVEAAIRAPSAHNTQPWCWHGTDHTLELYADRSRQLHASDPAGRNLVISGGAALHHAQVAAEALGWSSDVHRLPEATTPDLLARLVLSPAPVSARAQEVLDAVAERRTDRRRFTAWPVPDGRVTRLATIAIAQGASAVPVTDVTDRFRAERLMNRATEVQRNQPYMVREQDTWLDRTHQDEAPSSELPSRQELATVDDIGGRELEESDGLIVMVAGDDVPAAWLRAGEGLSALWLSATMGGLSVVPLSRLVEVVETREAFRRDVLAGMAEPLLLVRIGWQAMGRGPLARTPRRPVEEVLTLDS